MTDSFSAGSLFIYGEIKTTVFGFDWEKTLRTALGRRAVTTLRNDPHANYKLQAGASS